MSNQLVTDADAKECLDFFDSAHERMSAPRQKMRALQVGQKTAFAKLYNDAPHKSSKDKEMWAYAHEDYISYNKMLIQAETEFEDLELEYKAKDYKWNSWRTSNANMRKFGA